MQFMDGCFMNLGEEVILTLLWQSGISESATVFVISLSICYWLFKCWVLRVVCVCVCVCVCVRGRERGGGGSQLSIVFVCVRVRERDGHSAVLCVCVLACVRERETHGHITTVACVQTHTSFITVSVKWLCSPLWLELMVKLRTLLPVFTIIVKANARDYGYVTFPTRACRVRPIKMLWFSWQIRADFACRKEGLCRKLS